MGYKFNIFTSQFDLVNDSQPGGGGDVIGPGASTSGNIAVFDDGTGKLLADSGVSVADLQAFSQTFILTDWVGPAGDSYTLTITKATHGKDNPICVLYELNGVDYIQVEAGVRVSDVEDVIITVNDIPDNRFIGKIVIN